MNGIKADIKIDMTAEHRQKISNSKTLYHNKLTALFDLIDEMAQMKKDIDEKNKRDKGNKNKKVEKRIL